MCFAKFIQNKFLIIRAIKIVDGVEYNPHTQLLENLIMFIVYLEHYFVVLNRLKDMIGSKDKRNRKISTRQNNTLNRNLLFDKFKTLDNDFITDSFCEMNELLLGI